MWLVSENKRETETAEFYKKRYERYVKTVDSLRQRLSKSNHLRDSLVRSSRDLHNDFEDLLRRDSLKDAEIKNLKSDKYNNHTSKQLEQEMIKRYRE